MWPSWFVHEEKLSNHRLKIHQNSKTTLKLGHKINDPRCYFYSVVFNFKVPRKITDSFYKNFFRNHEINESMM